MYSVNIFAEQNIIVLAHTITDIYTHSPYTKMVDTGLWKGLSKLETLELSFELRVETEWGNFTDWQAANSKQME